MEDFQRRLEYIFICSSTVSNCYRIFDIAPAVGICYLIFLASCFLGWVKLQPPRGTTMFSTPLSLFNAFIFFTLLLSKFSHAQTSTTGFRPEFTVPAEADVSVPVIPNIKDPNATDAQTVCPGYTASNVLRNNFGLTASLNLAGEACNVYGTDIETLNLTVEYQSADRLAIRIVPAYIDDSNSSYFLLPDHLVHQPTVDEDAASSSLSSDLNFVWSNDPSFSFSVYRVSTGDELFSTRGTKLVFENQFIEFASSLPENYNLYGLGETIHGLRLGNNFTKTMWAADIGDPIDL